MENKKTGTRFFRRISLITLLAVYFLILVGGIVRSTGAGMGCPDWPKCFGSWIPPTSEEMLPENYKEMYVDYRVAKNQKFASYLAALGFDQKSDVLLNDESIKQETPFNVVKTWIEYINRLIGALIGILIFINLITSFSYIKTDKIIFLISLFLFILVVFQGWIGSLVVSTNLIPWMVTVHMVLAVVIIALLVYLVFRSRIEQYRSKKIHQFNLLNSLLILSGLFIVIQIILGSQVREAIDLIASSLNYQHRNTWIGSMGTDFFIHRSFSLIPLALQIGILVILIKNKSASGNIFNFAKALLILIILEVGFGVIMAYAGIPPFIQPVHLLFGVLIFGLQFFLLLIVNNYRTIPLQKKISI